MTDFSAYSDKELAQILAEHFDKIPERDQSFAASLRDSVGRWGTATARQRPHLERMVAKAMGVETERVKTPVGDLSGVMALFDGARQHLKAPAIVVKMGDDEIRLSIAGPSAFAPGTINVATNEGYGASEWFGRILLDGQFEASPRVKTPSHVVEGLKRFAAEPAQMAAEHGKLTGKCCFCNRPLTDERSTHVGYGATCASRWSLPYPKLSEVKSGGDLFAA
jgi:Family of unknown function (DUF6011)